MTDQERIVGLTATLGDLARAVSEYEDLHGDCLLENLGQREKRERVMRSPHGFVADPRPKSGAARLGMCRLCLGRRDDPLHVLPEEVSP